MANYFASNTLDMSGRGKTSSFPGVQFLLLATVDTIPHKSGNFSGDRSIDERIMQIVILGPRLWITKESKEGREEWPTAFLSAVAGGIWYRSSE
jgi:hypothetical protein